MTICAIKSTGTEPTIAVPSSWPAGGIEVRDITEDAHWLAAAHRQVAAGYSRLLAPGRRLDRQDICKALCEDGYEQDGRSRTFAVLVPSPETGQPLIAGAVRLVLGRRSDAPGDLLPIDAMNFVSPRDGWPHHRNGAHDGQIAELGRFVIDARFRTPRMRAEGMDVTITGELLQAVYRCCSQIGIRMLFGIMPAVVADLVARTGAALTEVPMVLRHEDEHAARIFEEYSTYWTRLAPHLYQVTGSRPW